MKTFFRLLTLLMTVPIVELFFLIQVEKLFDGWTGGNGLLMTMALIIVTAVAGSYLAKREGFSAWKRLQGRLSGGGLPGDELLDAVIILVAGAFLITPGVLTDIVGFTGLIPLTRGWIRRLVKRRLKKAMREGRIQTSFGAFGGPFGSTGMSGGEAPPAAGEREAGGPSVEGTPAQRGPASAPPENDASPTDENGTPRSRALDEGSLHSDPQSDPNDASRPAPDEHG